MNSIQVRVKKYLGGSLWAAAAALAFAAPTQAQVESSELTTIIVPFPAGGAPDIAARVLADKLYGQFGQTVVVKNKPGASSTVGTREAARAKPDGHTLLFTTISTVIAPYVIAQGAASDIDLVHDFEPIVATGLTPMIIVAQAKLGIKTLGQLIKLAASSNPSLSYASAGVGSGTHFAGEMFKLAAKANLLHVPYGGVAPSILGTIRDDTPVLVAPLGATLPHIEQGKLTPVALLESRRSPLLPDVPTAAESGVDVEMQAWYGMFAPAGTSSSVIAQLNRKINDVLAAPEVKSKFATAGIEVLGGSANQLGEMVKRDKKRYGDLAQKLNIKTN